MSNNKQSSVEWLISQLQRSKDWHRVLNEVSQMNSAKIDIIGQAKAMHKEEIENAVDGFPIHTRSLNGNDYYNEHYGNN